MKSEAVQSVLRSPKWEIKPKLHRYPTKRWGHTAVLHKNKLFIYGGKTGKLREPLYELDCETFQSHIHQMHGFPESRESHSCSLVKEKLYIWGGCRQDKALNDCVSIGWKDAHPYWNIIAQFPNLKQRQSHATTVLKDKYIFLYGGSNEDDIYDDFWVFNTDLDIWFQVKNIVGKMKKRLGCTLTTIKDKIYMFGGELEDETYQNQVYCLSFTELQFNAKQKMPEMKCQKIVPISSKSPQGRSCHSTVCYSERYLIIIAGEGQGLDAKGKSTSILFNDMWSFDTQRLSWELIDIPNPNVFKPRSCFSASLFKNRIFIFGGLISTENFKSSDQLLILSFSQNSQKPLDMCNICKLHYRPIEAKKQKHPEIEISNRMSFDFGLSNLYKISRMIKNPFDAICLLLEAYQRMKYNSVAIDLVEGKLLIIQGTGLIINQEQFAEILSKYQFVQQIVEKDPKIIEALSDRINQQNLKLFGFNLKNASSRLGQNFLFMNRRGILMDLMYVNHENIYYCELNTSDHSVCPQQEPAKQIILNYIHRNNIIIGLVDDQSFVVVITELQRISPTQSQMRVNGKNLIQIAGSSKKTTLQSYISTMFARKPKINITINSKALDFKDPQTQFQDCTYEPVLQHDLLTIKVRQSQKQQYISIYRGGIRVGRYKKTGMNIQGYVEISLHYELNILRNRIENTKLIEEQLDKICEQFQQNYRKRKNQVAVHELENNVKNG